MKWYSKQFFTVGNYYGKVLLSGVIIALSGSLLSQLEPQVKNICARNFLSDHHIAIMDNPADSFKVGIQL